MSADAGETDLPAEWLRHAKSHLIRAKQPRQEGVLWEHLCFDAQQAAEKALKAVLASRQVAFPHTHDLTDLLGLLYEARQSIPDEVRAVAALTPYAVQSRYPGFESPVTHEEWEQAVGLAEQVVHWAEAIVRGA